jgi:MraZ protein
MDAFFVGQYDYQMDDRNRIPIPPRYRAAFKDGGYVAQGTGPFLVIHTEESLARAAEAADEFPSESDYGESVRRSFFSNAWPMTPDGQGRITLDPRLLGHAGIKKEVIVAGTGRRLEIWDRATWEANAPGWDSVRHEAMNRRGGQ